MTKEKIMGFNALHYVRERQRVEIVSASSTKIEKEKILVDFLCWLLGAILSILLPIICLMVKWQVETNLQEVPLFDYILGNGSLFLICISLLVTPFCAIATNELLRRVEKLVGLGVIALVTVIVLMLYSAANWVQQLQYERLLSWISIAFLAITVMICVALDVVLYFKSKR